MTDQETFMNDDMGANDMADKPSLSHTEKDALGEIGNICMGTCATTLSTLLGKRVVITTPQVVVCKGNEYLEGYERPVVATEVSYTQGIDGHNVFLLKKDDALLITSLLMGGGQSEEEIGDMYLSAMSEVMNQMVGSSSTALADILQISINISPPVTKELPREEEVASIFGDEVLAKISFKMEIEDLLVSNIMQIMPYEFAKKLAGTLTGEDMQDTGAPSPPAPSPPVQAQESAPDTSERPVPDTPGGVSDSREYATGSQGVPAREERPAASPMPREEKRGMDLKSVKFESFDDARDESAGKQQNIDLIIDVPLQVTVVLGKCRKSIKEILEMDMGSVVVLDRLAGEMVDVLVNGKIFAKGEVVVIDDNYGIRITEMMSGQVKI